MPPIARDHATRAMHESVGQFLIWIGVGVGVLLAAIAVFVLVRWRRRRRAAPTFVEVRVNSVRQRSRPDSVTNEEKVVEDVDLEAGMFPSRRLSTIPESASDLGATPLASPRPPSTLFPTSPRPAVSSPLAARSPRPSPSPRLRPSSITPSPTTPRARTSVRSFRASAKPPRLSLHLSVRLSMVSSVFRGLRTPSTARTASTARSSAWVPDMPALPPAARLSGSRRSRASSKFSWLTWSSAGADDAEGLVPKPAKLGRRRVVDSGDFHPMNRTRSRRAARQTVPDE